MTPPRSAASVPTGIISAATLVIAALAIANVTVKTRAASESAEGVTAGSSTACDMIASFVPPGGRITSAGVVGAGGFESPNGRGGAAFTALPAFCRVQAVLKPVPESAISVEVWLPLSGWNRRFQGVGNRGWGGTISYAALGQALSAGYASASTDTGHAGGGGSFALAHPERIVDAGWRAVHEMTMFAKAIAGKFYASDPAFSYWNGCSLGGRQGYAEAQRYPGDYDGIVAGDPASDLTHLYAARMRWAQIVHRSATSAIPPDKFALIHRAALAACDAKDGVSDGVIEDPTRCQFDPGVLECAGADRNDCLPHEQVESVRALYSPVVHPRTHAVLAPGLEPGSEMGWGTVAGAQPEGNALDLFRYVVFKDPDWDWHAFNLETDIDLADRAVADVVNATSPDLSKFFSRNGKLLLYHGWSDPQTPPLGTVTYVERLRSGATVKAADSVRLFMVPGMGHCEGGDGTDTFDKMSAIVQWVEAGVAPTRMLASHLTNGQVDRTRPLCPFGQVARWSGQGSSADVANFACAARER